MLHTMKINDIMKLMVNLKNRAKLSDREISIITEFYDSTIPALMFIDDFKCISSMSYYKGLIDLHRLTGYHVDVVYIMSFINRDSFLPRTAMQYLMLYIMVNNRYSNDDKQQFIQSILDQKNFASSKLEKDIMGFLINRSPNEFKGNIEMIMTRVFNRRKLLQL